MSQPQAHLRPDRGSATSTTRWAKVSVLIVALVLLFFILNLASCGRGESISSGNHDRLDAEAISKAAGTKTMTAEDGTVGIRWVRDDVKVTVDKMPVNPVAGLASVAAFHPTQDGAIIMGDMIVFQDEVTPAMDAAFKNGLEVTGLHNHFAFDEPKVYGARRLSLDGVDRLIRHRPV